MKEGPKSFGFDGREYALVRNFSIDERHRGNGYGSEIFKHLPEFMNQEINADIRTLILGVNVKNIAGQKAYTKAGFKEEFITQGPIGDLIIMSKAW